MTRTARIGFAAVLLLGGATIAMAQNGPPTGGILLSSSPLRLPSSPPRLLPPLKGALRPPQGAAFFFFGGWIIALPTSDGGSITPAVLRYLRQSVSAPRPTPIILPLISAPVLLQNRRRRAPVRRGRARQSKRPIPRQSKAAGSSGSWSGGRRQTAAHAEHDEV
jgi:hypothetical protein